MYELMLVSEEIARALNEPNIALIKIVVEVVGLNQTMVFLGQAIEVEARGCMLTANHKRRHTLGNIFFLLLKKNISIVDRNAILLLLSQNEEKSPDIAIS